MTQRGDDVRKLLLTQQLAQARAGGKLDRLALDRVGHAGRPPAIRLNELRPFEILRARVLSQHLLHHPPNLFLIKPARGRRSLPFRERPHPLELLLTVNAHADLRLTGFDKLVRVPGQPIHGLRIGQLTRDEHAQADHRRETHPRRQADLPPVPALGCVEYCIRHKRFAFCDRDRRRHHPSGRVGAAGVEF